MMIRPRDRATMFIDDLVHGANIGLSRRSLFRRGAVLGLTAPAAWQSLRSSPARATALQDNATTLTIGLFGSPSDLDPHSLNDFLSGVVARGAYEGLIALKGNTTDEYEGRIAESWDANADQSVWTFHLREGVTFQDGSPCDAEAVRASCERLLTLGRGLSYVLARFVSDPGQITAPNARTVVFDLGRPQPLFAAAMAASAHVVNVKLVLTHEVEGDWGNAWLQVNAEGTGTGPYRIVEFEPGERAVLERYEGYWGGWDGPHFDRIIVRAVEEPATLRQLIERGEVDIIDRFGVTPEALPELERHPDLRVDRSTTSEVAYFVLTVAGPLATPEARRAMCFAFPYKEVVTGVSQGYAKRARGSVAEKVRGFAPETFQYTTDLARAKELFAQAGVVEGTTLTLIQPAGGDQLAAQLFQSNLDEIGIQLSIEALDFTTYTAIFYGDAPAEERPNVMAWGWWPEYNDAWSHLYPLVSCEAWGSQGGNAGFYCNERVDELLAEARDAVDLETYETALAEAQQILSRDDPPAIYYAQPEWITVLRRDVAGFVLNPIFLGSYDLYRLHRAP
jgi:peptide/nickel transport system substrate-binding protein